MVSGDAARLTVLSGPSGVGKGTVVAEVRRRHPDVWLSVSVTTRRPRPGEVDGVHYHFVDDAEFDRLIELDASGEFDVVVVNDDVARAADELVGLLTAPSPGLVPGE